MSSPADQAVKDLYEQNERRKTRIDYIAQIKEEMHKRANRNNVQPGIKGYWR